MEWINWIGKVVQMAGTKLPLIWPDILEIGRRVEHILSVLKGNVFGASAQMVPMSDNGAKLVETIAEQGIDREEAKKVLAIAEQAETL